MVLPIKIKFQSNMKINDRKRTQSEGIIWKKTTKLSKMVRFHKNEPKPFHSNTIYVLEEVITQAKEAFVEVLRSTSV